MQPLVVEAGIENGEGVAMVIGLGQKQQIVGRGGSDELAAKQAAAHDQRNIMRWPSQHKWTSCRLRVFHVCTDVVTCAC